MAVRKITNKSQIPDYIKKRIPDFNKITLNRAVFEYEKILLLRRAKGDFKEYLKEYVKAPTRVTKSDIQNIRGMRGEKLKEERIKYYDEKWVDSGDNKPPKVEPPEPPKVEPPEIPNPEPITVPDLPDTPAEPEPSTPLYVDMSTGEAIYEEDLPDYMDRLSDFIDDLIDETRQEMDRAIVSYSAYRSGKTRNARGRAWIETNITRAGNKLISKLEEIKSNEDSLKTFAQKCNNPDYMQQLKDAIGDYISSSYYIVDIDGYFSNSRVYNLLSFTPMSLDDTMDFEYEE